MPKSLVNFNFPKKDIHFPGNQIFRKSFVLAYGHKYYFTIILPGFLAVSEWPSG